MQALPTAAIQAVSQSALEVTELEDLDIRKEDGAVPLTVSSEDGEEITAASAAAWANHRQDEFLRVLTHRLSNPLAPIVTCIQILQSRAPQDRLLHHALDLMNRQLANLVGVLEDLRSADRSGRSARDPEAQRAYSGTPGPGGKDAMRLNAQRALGAVISEKPKQLHEHVNGDRSRGSKHRVLVVDDNLDAAEALRLLLCIKGFEVFTASDGTEAIQRTEECAPDIIFMDIQMPQMDGWEAARRIHAMPEFDAIPIIAMTGLDQDSDRERSRESGMVGHLVKPLEVTTVQEVLRSLIGRPAAGRAQ
jgi:CheY-like chemotaxis protein